jgi:hypothetical protein
MKNLTFFCNVAFYGRYCILQEVCGWQEIILLYAFWLKKESFFAPENQA